MASKEIILTREAFEEYQKKLDYYKTHHRKEVAERIRQAKEFGEIGENSEYEDAKSEQAFIEGEILSLENILRSAKILDEKEIPKDRVSLGSTVVLKNTDTKKEVEYTIVGTVEANPSRGLVSNESPVGSALIGAQKDESLEIKVPKGILNFKVVKIYQKQHLDAKIG
jgi:transcription elongation factor GreA